MCHQSIALVQRAIELRGIPTVSISVAYDITEHIKPPRAVFVPFMMGHLFGVPFHIELQRRVILAALDHIVTAKHSAEIVRLPITWAQARREGIVIEQTLGAKRVRYNDTK